MSSFSLNALVLAACLVWALSVWSASKAQSPLLTAAGAGLIVVCIGLTTYGLCFSAPLSARPRFPFEIAFQYSVVPVFLMLPAAVSFCISQFLRRKSVTVAKARIAAILGSACAAGAVPFAALAAGCGLAGACF